MANFTPQEIEEMLQAFFDTVGKRQYVGARYVPIFGRRDSDNINWDNSDAYEPLTIVLYNGDSYTSKRYVPAGVDIMDTDYWVITGRYNAQVEQYRQEVLGFSARIDGAYGAVEELRSNVEDDYIPFPEGNTHPKYGTAGQVLSTLANGATEWVDPVVPSDAQAESVITTWLDEHPEATTTVQDGAITTAKLADGSVTTPKIADSNVTTQKLADSSVTTPKIANGAVTEGKISADVKSNLMNDILYEECPYSPNMYDKSLVIDGKYVNNNDENAALASLETSILSGYVPVEEGTEYTITCGPTLYCGAVYFYAKQNDGSYRIVCGYGKNGATIGGRVPAITGLVTASGTRNVTFTPLVGSGITHALWYIASASGTNNYYGAHTGIGTIADAVQMNAGSTVLPYTQFVGGLQGAVNTLKEHNQRITQTEEDFDSIYGVVSNNKYDPSIVIDGKYINPNSSAGDLASTANSILTGYIPIKEGVQYCARSGNGFYMGTTVFYHKNADGTYTAVCGVAKDGSSQYGSIPLATSTHVDLTWNSRYIKFKPKAGSGITHVMWFVTKNSATNQQGNYYGDHSAGEVPTIVGGVQLNIGSEFYTYDAYLRATDLSDYIGYVTKSNILNGKRYCATGDSITYGADMDSGGLLADGTPMSYPWIIADRNNMIFTNDGVSGSSLAAGTSRNGFAEQNGRYTQLPDELDYLTIWFGWNDAACIEDSLETLGTISSTDTNSFYGAYNTVLEYLIDKYPNTKIGLIVPFGTTAELRQAVRDVAQKWGLSYFDNYQGNTPLYYGKEDESVLASGLVSACRAKWQANGAHPNYAGHQQLALQIEQWMRGL